jgi:cobaltochelatase CobS
MSDAMTLTAEPLTDLPGDGLPDITVSARETFGLATDLQVPAFATATDHVPDVDPAYRFQPEVTRAVLAGFAHNRRVLVQGLHGTGKSTHIEQIAARLNWPCVRINLDGHLSRLDLLGKDAITLRDGHPVTEYVPGILPWAIGRPVALVLDEYDAGRPEVMFVLQRLLERDGKLTLLDQSTVLHPHPSFRIFATSNTVGLGDLTGLYRGTQRLNHAQLDRWDITTNLSYLPVAEEVAIVLGRVPGTDPAVVEQMVCFAGLTRSAYAAGDLATVMSPRSVISWAENTALFGDVVTGLRVTFTNRCDPDQHDLVGELFQRCFDSELTPDATP